MGEYMEDYVTKAVHEEFAKRMEEEDKRQNKRIEYLEGSFEKLGELITSVKVLAVSVENMAAEIRIQGDRLKEIEGKPAKRWETIVSCIITGLVGAAIAYFIAR